MSESKAGMTYAGSGVNYDDLDPFKKGCQEAARRTNSNIEDRWGGEFKFLEASRGESCSLVEAAKSYLALVEEGLGTKNLVADEMYRLTGKSYYDSIAQDTMAMIVNDMITVGALPLSAAMHVASGDSEWFKDEVRSGDLIRGWQAACNWAGCVWGGGETPALKDVVIPGTVVLSGSAQGLVKPKEHLITPDSIQADDAIILIESSGIHANGLTMARKIAESLKEGYLTRLSDGRSYGESLLDPTHIYVSLIRFCQERGIKIHYAVNITGHGLRKLMRAPQPFHYVIETLLPAHPVFGFIQEQGSVSLEEMYGTFNMGNGFALYVAQEDAEAVMQVAFRCGFTACRAGTIQESNERKVTLKPLGLEYSSNTLEVR